MSILPRRALRWCAAAGFLGCALAAHPTASLGAPGAVVVVADRGDFASLEAAAHGEARVNWWDDDPRDDAACTGAFAALELQRFLPACFGMPRGRVRAVAAARAPRRGRRIVLRLGAASSADTALGAAGRRLRAQSYRVHLADGDRDLIVIEGGGPAGMLYGAYALLERLGMRFFAPGSLGTIAPTHPAAWPSSLDLEDSPGFETRGFWAWEPRADREFLLWMARNRFNLWTATERDIPFTKKLGMRLTGGGHTLQHDLLAPELREPGAGGRTRFELHPEWYGLVDGARSPDLGRGRGVNFCTSNDGAVGEFLRGLVDSLAGPWSRVDILQFWMLDNGRWCECDRCSALGTPTDRLLRLLDQARRAIAEARAAGRLAHDVELWAPAFLETLPPPTRPVPPGLADGSAAITFLPIDRCYVHALGDPSCREINAYVGLPARLWMQPLPGGVRLPGVVGEYYNLAELKSVPAIYPHVIAVDIPWYYRLGYRAFYYMHVPTRRWGPFTFEHVLLARLLWDPDADPSAIEDDFLSRYYPSTGPIMRAFLSDLERGTADFKPLMQRVQVGRHEFSLSRQLDAHVTPFVMHHLQRRGTHGPTDDAPGLDDMVAAMARARADLDRARRACRDAAERARLDEDAARFEYGDAMATFFDRLVAVVEDEREGRPDDARAAWPALHEAAERLRAVHDLIHVASSDGDAPDGLAATGQEPRYLAIARRYGAAAPAR